MLIILTLLEYHNIGWDSFFTSSILPFGRAGRQEQASGLLFALIGLRSKYRPIYLYCADIIRNGRGEAVLAFWDSGSVGGVAITLFVRPAGLFHIMRLT
ncbi:hypothetical protein KL86CLO1_10777 [uncultured Eubacteriales bacterium]|uniref:Uncharacterized protein n=1 Tax=uncultured Eubacteriales bacterium TaxID=172733 RepID=A0A212JAH8_9FIRM|nr:hypothetical protein KL86CLO1_10777 [uncultured Eubacteriales bacterium]